MTVSFLGLEVRTIEGGFQTRRRRCDWLLANRTVQFPALFAVLPSDADVTRSRIFATPASAQASSLSPPGAPPTPLSSDDLVPALDGDAAGERQNVRQRNQRRAGRALGDEFSEAAGGVELEDRTHRDDGVGLPEARGLGVD